jgi:hypothetical protein
MATAREAYTAGRDVRAAEAQAHERTSRALSLVRLAVAAVAVVLVGAIVWVPLPSFAWAGEAALVVAFGVLVVVHSRVLQRKDAATAAMRFHERGLARLDGKWTAFPQTGERFRNDGHPFADDLDLFGHASLFQLLDATETRFGEERLAAVLAATEPRGWPGDVRARQEAILDLAPRVAFRERLSALGALLAVEKPDPRPFLEWAEGSLPFPHGAAVVFVARALPAAAVALLVAASFVPRLWTAFVAVFALEVLISLALRGNVGPIAAVVSSRETGLLRYGDMFAAIEREPFEAKLLKSLAGRLSGANGRGATGEMASLARILSFLDARHNEVFRAFIGPFLLWDLNCVLALEGWRARTGAAVRAWFEALGEIEALASLAGFAFERPSHAVPELADAPVYDAQALGHPLLAEDRRVDNDVALQGPGFGLIVTGSNMSGKSTLLRAMGVNAVLALAGAPVCARRLRIGPLRVATSMRVRDSLEQGVSHFYAELEKLKRVLDLARTSGPGAELFLLDEILHGTNSRERILGARAILTELLRRGAMGAVSTHDLGISDLEAKLAEEPAANGGRLHARNVHFEEQVEGDKMTFDYRLRDGIVKSSNALRLMRLVGIDVVPS